MLGQRLRQLRRQRRKTQEEVARALGLKRARYSHYENGRNEPDAELLQKMAAYFDVSVDYLLGNESNDENNKSDLNVIDLLKEIKKRPYVIDPKTGEPRYIPEERLKIINDLIEGYLREQGILPNDSEDCANGL